MTRCGYAHPWQPPHPGVSTTCQMQRQWTQRPGHPIPTKTPTSSGPGSINGLASSGPESSQHGTACPRTRPAAPPRCCSPHTSVALLPSSTVADQWSKPARPPTGWPISVAASFGTTSALSTSHDGHDPVAPERAPARSYGALVHFSHLSQSRNPRDWDHPSDEQHGEGRS